MLATLTVLEISSMLLSSKPTIYSVIRLNSLISMKIDQKHSIAVLTATNLQLTSFDFESVCVRRTKGLRGTKTLNDGSKLLSNIAASTQTSHPAYHITEKV